jgi:hypothetical protein
VRRGHPARPLTYRLAGALVALLAGLRPARAQAPPARISATLDATAALVHYDGFLASGAASMTPALELDGPLYSLVARGTYLVFQSGNQSLQGLVAGSVFTPAAGPHGLLRAELSGTAGMSGYQRSDERVARYRHALGRARLHLLGANRGAYAGGSLGRTSLGGGPVGVAAAGAGVWRRFGWVSADFSTTATSVGRDTSYLDAELATRWVRGRWDVDATAGFRTLSDGAGRGAYGEAVAAYWLTPQLALVASGGRYPTDPTRGTVAGRYAALSVRIARRISPSPVSSLAYMRPYRLSRSRAAAAAVRRAGIEVLDDARANRGARGLRVRMPGASTVEVMGDFTDWEPVALTQVEDGVWELARPIAPGTYHLNVRADGGAWVVPPGVTAYADDFGGIVALVVVR